MWPSNLKTVQFTGQHKFHLQVSNDRVILLKHEVSQNPTKKWHFDSAFDLNSFYRIEILSP